MLTNLTLYQRDSETLHKNEFTSLATPSRVITVCTHLMGASRVSSYEHEKFILGQVTSVSIVTRLWAGFPTETRIFSLCHYIIQPPMGPTQPPIKWIPGFFSWW